MVNGGARETAAGNLRHAKLSEVCEWLENDNIDEIGDEESEEFVIEMDKNLIDAEARFEAITLEDDPLFKIELNFSNFSVHNSEFVDFDESDWK
ncbi:hypothetical protein RclHR1_07820004 [Rhizophagus clarus]|uniref:Uncharacterized protein n=1 Tax=Rhizophagus clarus TaxID=94130 RepID=A0A2Z6SMA1_9GLOM|nr:hypothetical protein RclHR1_07820004 [Rhizophagus clarus]